MDEEELMDDENVDQQSGSNVIQVYLRIRPPLTSSSKDSCRFVSIDEVEESRINFIIPKKKAEEQVNNSRTHYSFYFDGVMDKDASQAQVFQKIGKPAVENALNGFNATVFAYGQTGSGKTFTITGGPERYADRGVIPRAISMLFAEFHQRKKQDFHFTCSISYLEIYNETGYDLLASEHSEGDSLEDMPKVTMLEDEDGNYHFRNLSTHYVSSEEEALNCLFLGDTNRAISETEMNQTSTRSHCIFIANIEIRRPGSDSVVKSKLNLVDLAGSERVHKTGNSGQTLKEAKFINSSLFFLEMVIIALQKQEQDGGKSMHIPYRNSMMTSVLRDSLGGNCKTVMIATISPDEAQTDESISTCNFAKRVAMVKNSAHVNEELEPELIIHRLKRELHRLREEVKFLKGENGEDETVSSEERTELTRLVVEYVDSRDIHAVLDIGKITLTKVYDVYAVFKNLVLEAKENTLGDDSQSSIIEQLKMALKEREREINVLVNLVKKTKGIPSSFLKRRQPPAVPEDETNNCQDKFVTNESDGVQKYLPKNAIGVPKKCKEQNPSKAYAWFRQHYTGMKSIEENTLLLKEKYEEAKQVGSSVKAAKEAVVKLKNQIEQIRKRRALDSINEPSKLDEIEMKLETDEIIHPNEVPYRNQIEKEKEAYKTNFNRLRELKATIEHIQNLIENGKKRMQKDFDIWYGEMLDKDDTSLEEEKRDHGDNLTNNTLVTLEENNDETVMMPKGVKLTGNKTIDNDIIAFYKAKELLLSRKVAGTR